MRQSILIVDTDPAVERMVMECVNDPQADFEMVSDVAVGREFIVEQGATLIVLNADMPKGWRFCAELKKDPATAPIPLMLLSGKATDEVFNQHQLLPTRANAYVRKPVDPADLRIAIMGLLFPASGGDVDIDLSIEAVEVTEAGGIGFVEHTSPEDTFSEGDTEQGLGAEPIAEQEVDLARGLIVSESLVLPPVAPPPMPAAPTPPPMPTAAQPSPSPRPAPEPTQTFSAERDALQARVSELAQTGKALESAQSGQAQELEQLRRENEAISAERDLLEDTRRRLQGQLEQALVSSPGGQDVLEVQALRTRVASLEAFIRSLRGLLEETNAQASAGDDALRQVIAGYQHREQSILEVRAREAHLTDNLLAVVEHVYEGLDLLRQDIHNGVPEIPEMVDLPSAPLAVPDPFEPPTVPHAPSPVEALPVRGLDLPIGAGGAASRASLGGLIDPLLAEELGEPSVVFPAGDMSFDDRKSLA